MYKGEAYICILLLLPPFSRKFCDIVNLVNYNAFYKKIVFLCMFDISTSRMHDITCLFCSHFVLENKLDCVKLSYIWVCN